MTARRRKWRSVLVGMLGCLGTTCIPAAALTQPVQASQELPAAIPLFPLRDVVLFPDTTRKPSVFEPRYRAMVADALQGDRVIGTMLLRPGFEADYEGRPPVHAVGCAGSTRARWRTTTAHRAVRVGAIRDHRRGPD